MSLLLMNGFYDCAITPIASAYVESISTLDEMELSQDHAAEVLESVGINLVEVSMEYAVTHACISCNP